MDLVNTLDERPSPAPVENLTTYGDLVSFAELAGLIEPAMAESFRSNQQGSKGTRIVGRVREAREHLYSILIAAHRLDLRDETNSLHAIAADVRRAHGARTLLADDSSGAIRHGWIAPTALEIPLFACALAIETLLVRTDFRRIRKCAASDCDVFFIDTSKGHRRQWCSMRNCGNREKQRRWRSAPA